MQTARTKYDMKMGCWFMCGSSLTFQILKLYNLEMENPLTTIMILLGYLSQSF